MTEEHSTSIQSILSIDIGGSYIKMVLLNAAGEICSEYFRTKTPNNASPELLLQEIHNLEKSIPQAYDAIAVGFPGYVRLGLVYTAPNLKAQAWIEIPFALRLANAFLKPVRMVNDADLQAIGAVSGKGLEMLITLGTGLGTALLYDGVLLPHLELAHFPVQGKYDYDDYLGNKALKKYGGKIWNTRLARLIKIYKTVFNYDRLYISGGNSRKITLKTDSNIILCSNEQGIKGGAALWQAAAQYHIRTIFPDNTTPHLAAFS